MVSNMDVYSAKNFLSRPIGKPSLNNCQKRRGYKTNKKHQEGISEFIRQILKLFLAFILSISFKFLY